MFPSLVALLRKAWLHAEKSRVGVLGDMQMGIVALEAVSLATPLGFILVGSSTAPLQVVWQRPTIPRTRDFLEECSW